MISINDFKAENDQIRTSIFESIQRVIDSGWYILGNELKSFESNWSRICKVKHSLGVGNGMDAIEIILKSLNIGQGDEVITTSCTAFATVLAIIKTGATPVIADIDIDTGLMTIESSNRCLTNNTKAIILVHLYGQMKEMHKWQAFSKENKVFLIEDCAQSHLAISNGKVSGTYGIAGAYSFYPTKNLGAFGDAGMIITDDDQVANQSSMIRNYGQSERYYHPIIGLNSRLDELQAAILNERVKWLNEFTQKRKWIANQYFNGIKNNLIQLLSRPDHEDEHVYHLFVIKCEKRETLMKYLNKNNIQSLIHYPIPIHYQESCLNIKRDPLGLKNSENFSSICLTIPCHPQLTTENVDYIINVLNNFR